MHKNKKYTLISVLLTGFLLSSVLFPVDYAKDIKPTLEQTETTPKPTDKPATIRLTPTPKPSKAEELIKPTHKEEVKKRVDELRDELAKARCEKASLKVGEIQDRIGEAKKKNDLSVLVTKFEKTSVALKAKGLDTTKLDTDILKLKTLIANRKDFASVATAALQKTEDFQCMDKRVEDKGFISAFAEAKKNIEDFNKSVRDDAKLITAQLKIIREDLVSLKSSLKLKLESETKIKPTVKISPTSIN
jgi:ribosomal protein L29